MATQSTQLPDPAPRTRLRTHRGKSYPVSEAHPVADCYQWLTEGEIDALAASIRERGLEKPIHRLPDGRIVDGRNRELACLVARIEPRYEVRALGTEAEVVAHIRAANDYRRHGSESQRAMTAARLANLRRGANQHAPKVDGAQAPSISQQEVAGQFGVSRDLVKRATIVLRRGVNDLAAAVDEGRLDVTTAARVARLARDVQLSVVSAADPKSAVLRLHAIALAPPAPHPGTHLVEDGDTFTQIVPDAPTVGSWSFDNGTAILGLPKVLADGRAWKGWYLDIRRGMRTAYLIPAKGRRGWFVVVLNVGTDEWRTHNFPLKAAAARDLLTNPERFDFDLFAAYWQPTKRFARAEINPLYLDPDYAPTLPPELKQFVSNAQRLAQRKANGSGQV